MKGSSCARTGDHSGHYVIEEDRLITYTGRETHLVLPAGIRHIADEAFLRNPSLRAVVFPDSVEHIGNRAFFACPSLQEVLWGPRLQSIGAFAFADCSLLHMPAFPDALREIGDYAFSWSFGSGEGAKGEDGVVRLPRELVRLGEGAFWGCRGLLAAETLRAPMLGRTLYDPDKKSGHWADSIRFKGHFISFRAVDSAKTQYIIWMASRAEQRSYLDALMELWSPDGQLNLEAYDNLFPTMVSKEDKTKVSLYRLLYPRDLTRAAEERYLSWLGRHAVESVESVEDDHRWMLLELLSARELLRREQANALFDAVNRKGDARCIAWLIRNRQQQTTPRYDDLTL
jgi:hypothetical protein